MLTAVSITGISLISLVGVFTLPAGKHIRALLPIFVGVAVGALLGDAFIHLIPEAFEALPISIAVWGIFGGLGVFFVLEKFLHWHHHHETHEGKGVECTDCAHHIAPYGYLTIASDVLHNILDGVIVAAGFLVSPQAGIATVIAVALHELPQEIGDFGVLLHAGFSRSKAIALNFLSALSAFFGAFIALAVGASIEHAVPLLSAIAAGSFIYIAMADLVPELHKTNAPTTSFIQFAAVLLGIALVAMLLVFE